MVAISSDDLAVVLAAELEGWLQNLSLNGVIVNAFTGVMSDGSQVTLILNGLPLNHVQERGFMIWLCRTQRFVAYGYAAHVEIFNEDCSASSEGIDIYASSQLFDANKVLGVHRLSEGGHELRVRYDAVTPAGASDCIFFGLQRDERTIVADDEAFFGDLWAQIRTKAFWRQRGAIANSVHGLN